MAKKYDYQLFNFTTMEGETITVQCWAQSTSYGFKHEARIYDCGVACKCIYYNRTWESFKYETVILKALRALFPLKKQRADLAFVEAQVNAITQAKRDEAQAWIDNFTTSFNALSDATKNAIKNSDLFIETIEQADALLKGAQLLDIINKEA